MFHPELAENVLGYRAERLAGAAAKAARNNYQVRSNFLLEIFILFIHKLGYHVPVGERLHW